MIDFGKKQVRFCKIRFSLLIQKYGFSTLAQLHYGSSPIISLSKIKWLVKVILKGF